MNKKISLGLCISLMAIACAITFIISTSYSTGLYDELIGDVQKRSEMYQKLDQIDSYVRAYYDGVISEDELIESLSEGFVEVIHDDNARYYNKFEYEILKEQLAGTHLGIGVYTEEIGGYPCITEVLPDSPASSSGLKVGESIVEINSQNVLNLGYKNAVSALRSEVGTQLSLTVRSDGVDRKVSVSTTQMTVATVNAKTVGDYGYIKVTRFNEKTYQQFTAALSMLSTNGAKGFIIDLRNSQSLDFDPATNILTSILPNDSVVAVIEELSGEETVYDPATGDRAISVPVCVLINSDTSGPAELFAGALRDNLLASVVGTKSAGFCRKLDLFPLYDGTAIVLPTATIHSSKTNIDGVGLKPDFEVSIDGDTNEYLSTLDQDTDACIKKAIEVLTQK